MNKEARLKADGYVAGRDPEPILFYKSGNSYGRFSNFSQHQVVLRNPWTEELSTYLTGEHRYQAMKADNKEDHDYVLEVDNPGAAQMRGKQVSLREGWGQEAFELGYYVMFELVMAKTLQHSKVADLLFGTGNALIYEDSPIDDIWGWRHGPSYTGNNLLGRCWMEVRELLI